MSFSTVIPVCLRYIDVRIIFFRSIGLPEPFLNIGEVLIIYSKYNVRSMGFGQQFLMA